MRGTCALILCGGSGTRLWPVSKKNTPKFLVPFPDQQSLLQLTIRRLRGSVALPDVRFLCGPGHVTPIRQQVRGLSAKNFVVEPAARGTASCLGLALLEWINGHEDPVLVVLPCDHHVEKENQFQRLLRTAVAFAEKNHAIVTLGIRPSLPHTGYGYIEAFPSRRDVKKVRRFTEKPDLSTATHYVESGKYYWNAGIFVGRASVFWSEFRTWMPRHVRVLEKMAWTGDRTSFSQLPDESIDYGIMEKSSCIHVLPAEYGWNDVGDFAEYFHLLRKNRKLPEVQSLSSGKVFYHGPKKMVAAVGVGDLLIVETEGELLVLNPAFSQKIKDLVLLLQKKRKTSFL